MGMQGFVTTLDNKQRVGRFHQRPQIHYRPSQPRLVLTATSLPISSFAFWTKNVPHHCSQEDVQVFSPPQRCEVLMARS